MRKFLLFFILLLAFGCAKQQNLERIGGAQTGLPTFSKGDRFTSAYANTIDDFLEDHETRLDALEAGSVGFDESEDYTPTGDWDWSTVGGSTVWPDFGFDESDDYTPTGDWDWSTVGGSTVWPTFNQSTTGQAGTGDSATAFFAAGQIEAARGGTGQDSSAWTGYPYVLSGTWANTKIHYESGTPDANDDTDLGYVVYPVPSMWVDTSTGYAYICQDNTDGAAVWPRWGLVIGTDVLAPTGDGTSLSVTLADCTDLDCTADELLDSVNISPTSGTWDLSALTLTFPTGGWYFTDGNSAPDTAGQLKYDNTVTGYEDGALSFYDDDEVKNLVSIGEGDETLASADDKKVLRYNWDSGNGYFDLTFNPTTKCTTALAVTSASDWAIERFPFAVTITDIYVYQNGATNVIGGLDECTGANGTCGSVTAVDSDITGTDGAEVQDDGTLTNGGITAGNRIMWHTTSVSGTNTDFQVCFDYTID